jgi:hypothetical protein
MLSLMIAAAALAAAPEPAAVTIDQGFQTVPVSSQATKAGASKDPRVESMKAPDPKFLAISNVGGRQAFVHRPLTAKEQQRAVAKAKAAAAASKTKAKGKE